MSSSEQATCPSQVSGLFSRHRHSGNAGFSGPCRVQCRCGPCGRGHSGCGRPRPSSKAGHCCSISLVQSDRRATSDGRSERGRALPPCAGWGRVPGAGARERARWQRGAGRPVFSHPANVGLLPTFFLNVVIIRYKALFGFLFISLE